MGDVKDAVKGKPSRAHDTPSASINLVDRLKSMVEEVGDLIEKKDKDTLDEGPDRVAENTMKAGKLRTANSLLRSAKTILEDY